MKNIFRNIVSFLMAIVVLFSTFSFTVDMHYCGNELIDFSIYKPAQTCGMEKQKNDGSKENVSKNHCCTNEHLLVQGQKELKVNSFDLFSLDQQAILVSYIYSTINLFEGLQENIIPFKHYTPPLLVSKIQLENETFLI